MAKSERENRRRDVPLAEQPYKVPDNWRWVFLPGFAECLDNRRKPISADERALRAGDIPYYGATGQVGWIDDYLTDEQLVLLGEDGAPFLNDLKEKAYLIEGKAWVNNHAHILRSFYGSAGNRFLLRYLNNFQYAGYVNGTTRLKLTQSKMNAIPVPLPPFAEQQRIVERVEGLLSALDEARDRARAVLDGSETRKAVILYRAFRGELTKHWREMRGRDENSWKTLPFSDVAEVKSNLVNPLEFPNYPHIAPDNIEKKTGILLDYRTVEQDGVTSAKHLFHAGQILYTKIRPYLSKVIIADVDGLCSSDMYPIEPKEGFDTVYLWYYMLSDEFLYQVSAAITGSLLPRIRRKELSAVRVRVTDLDEQREIAAVLNRCFAKERRVREAAERVLKQLELMKKVILGRAFRGELGTNRPDEPPADLEASEKG